MMTKDDVKVDDIVYSIEPWSGRIAKSQVTELFAEGVRFKNLSFVDKNGKYIDRNFGLAGAAWDNLYPTAEEAYKGQLAKDEAAFLAYCEQIETVEDLVRFALENDITGGEYSDYNARKAYISRAKELGFDVEMEKERSER